MHDVVSFVSETIVLSLVSTELREVTECSAQGPRDTIPCSGGAFYLRSIHPGRSKAKAALCPKAALLAPPAVAEVVLGGLSVPAFGDPRCLTLIIEWAAA